MNLYNREIFDKDEITPLIRSVSDNQDTILNSIIHLFIPAGRFQVDPCYHRGGFYRSGAVPEPEFISDIDPQLQYNPNIQKFDCRQLPFKPESIDSIIFDPPWLTYPGKNLHGNMVRFGTFKSCKDMEKMHIESFTAFHQILKPKGILVVKCQDGTNGPNLYLGHIDAVILPCRRIGFKMLDLFILTAKNRIENRYQG
jgi:hypothetical protein